MKITNRFLSIAFLITTLALMASAQASSQTSIDNQEVRDRQELFMKFYTPYERTKAIIGSDPKLEKPENRKNYEKAAKEAFDYAKEFLKKYPDDTNPQTNVLRKYLQGYEKFEKESRGGQLNQLIKDKKYDEAFALGKRLLAEKPDDLATLASLANAGILSGQTESETNDAATIQYAGKAISLVEAGATMPGKSKEELLGFFHYAMGLSSLKTAPENSVKAFIQVATIPNTLQKTPQTFYYLAMSYQYSDYGKLVAEFKAQCTPEQLKSPNCVTTQTNLNKVIDRMIDANARVVSLSGEKPEFADVKAEAMKLLPGLYKYRHMGSDEGLKEFIAGAATRALP